MRETVFILCNVIIRNGCYMYFAVWPIDIGQIAKWHPFHTTTILNTQQNEKTLSHCIYRDDAGCWLKWNRKPELCGNYATTWHLKLCRGDGLCRDLLLDLIFPTVSQHCNQCYLLTSGICWAIYFSFLYQVDIWSNLAAWNWSAGIVKGANLSF